MWWVVLIGCYGPVQQRRSTPMGGLSSWSLEPKVLLNCCHFFILKLQLKVILTKAFVMKINNSCSFNIIFFTIFHHQKEFSAFVFRKKRVNIYAEQPIHQQTSLSGKQQHRVVAVVLMCVKSLRDWATHKTIPRTTHTHTHTHSVWRSKSKLYRRERYSQVLRLTVCKWNVTKDGFHPEGIECLWFPLSFNGILINVNGSPGWFLLELKINSVCLLTLSASVGIVLIS